MKNKDSLDRNMLGLILIFTGIILGLSGFGWLVTLNDICIVTTFIGLILIFIGVYIIK